MTKCPWNRSEGSVFHATSSALACFLASVVIATFGTIGPARGAEFGTWMVQLTLNGQKLEGSPISWSDREIHLLGRDGRLWTFDPSEVTDFANTTAPFRCYSPSELRSILLRELGSDYEVTGTGHYLVAHPRGEGDKWAQRFEDLYRSFVHYFAVRGFETTRPPFPLVGIVCKNQADFQRQTTSLHGKAMPNGVLGYYNPESNRIMLYDTGGKANSAHWKENAKTVIHEATHQMAFNMGVHSRYAPPPRWLAEGLAMLFEAPGVYDAPSNREQYDRIDHVKLLAIQQSILPLHKPELLVAAIASDDLMRDNPAAGYAEAWALTFFLVETEPAKYARYLKLTASRPPFTEYTSAARVQDFSSVFGNDWKMLNARFLRYITDLK